MIFHNVASAAVIGDATNEMNVKTGAKNMLVEGTGYASTVFTVTDVRAHGDNAIAITVEVRTVPHVLLAIASPRSRESYAVLPACCSDPRCQQRRLRRRQAASAATDGRQRVERDSVHHGHWL